MAATTVFPSLSVPAQEDSMEMSSPQNRNLDEDIDIDFDDNYDGGVQLQDNDEQMLTDGEQTRPATATDDMMDDDDDDDDQGQDNQFGETEMRDTPGLENQQTTAQEDEDLIDYGDDEYYDESREQQQIQDTAVEDVTDVIDYGNGQEGQNAVQDVSVGQYTNEPPAEASQESVDAEIVRQPPETVLEEPLEPAEGVETTVEAAPEIAVVEDAAAAVQPSAQEHIHTQQPELSARVSGPQDVDDAERTLVVEADSSEDLAQGAPHRPETQAFEGDTEATKAPLTVDVNADATNASPHDDADEAPGTPTDTGLHPMTLYYGEHVMPLFKSKKQQEGLLKDDNLANLSLAQLLGSCRERLSELVEDVPADRELTLRFDHLGLMLSETCKAAFQFSLNDVLQVYLRLHQNDGTVEVPALSLCISFQQFSNQLAVLQHAANSGKGMSAFALQHQYDEEYNEEDEAEEGEEGQEYYDGQYDVEQYNEGQEEQQDYYEGAEEGYEGQEYYAQDQEHEEPEYYDQDAENYQQPPEAEANTEKPEGPHGQTTNAAITLEEDVNVASEKAVDQTPKDTGNETLGQAGEKSGEADQADAPAEERDNASQDQRTASPASSETVQGDHVDGEYDDFEIDYSDDDLTEDSPDQALKGGDDNPVRAGGHYLESAQSDKGDGQAGDQDNAHISAGDHQRHSIASEDESAANPDVDGSGLEGHHNSVQYEDPQDEADTNGDKQPSRDDEQRTFADDFTEGQDLQHGSEQQPKRLGAKADEGNDLAQDEHQDDVFDNLVSGTDYQQAPEPAEEPAGDTKEYNIDDEIDFDDDTTEQHEARKASEADLKATAAASSDSPLGKRSREEPDEADILDFDDEEPETKKTRSA